MKVLARIALLPTEEGGLAQPLIGSFRPNHRFEAVMFVIGQVQQEPEAALHPGHSANLIVDFIPDGVPALAPGLEWRMYDGPSHLIGSATVLQIIDS